MIIASLERAPGRWAAVSLVLTLALACGSEPQAGTAASPPPSTAAPAKPTTAPAVDVSAEAEQVFVTRCVTCHGPRQFLQQRGDRATWLGLIRWMQSDHGMQALPDGVEDRIVDYLSKHYGPIHSGRRKPLRAELMPPNDQK